MVWSSPGLYRLRIVQAGCPAAIGAGTTGLQAAVQVVAMVTDGHQRPEIPLEDLCPSPSFPGMGEYIKLMQSCWKQVTVSRMAIGCVWSGKSS